MSSYKLSALVSVYQASRFMRGCLDNLIAQTLYKQGQLEIVIIDSASPEDEHVLVREYQAKHPHIAYHRTAERETLYGAWNTGIRISQGEYLTNANTDDRHREDALEKLCAVLDKDSSADLVYANAYRTNTANETFASYQGTTVLEYKPFFAPEVLLHYQFGPQPLWRRTVHQRAGYFNHEYKAAGDWEFNARFNLAGLKAVFYPEILGLFLDHPQALSYANQASAKEQALVRQDYCNVEKLLVLYQVSGWDVSTADTCAQALNDFALRASNYTLPWEPGRKFCDLSLIVPVLARAIELAPQKTSLVNNLGVVLGISGRINEALSVLNSFKGEVQDAYLNENKLLLQQGKVEGLKFYQQV